MDSTGVTWELMGQTVTADLNSPACPLATPSGPVVEGPRPTGPSQPSRSLPSAPSAIVAANATNRTGPGEFIVPTEPDGGWGTTPIPPEVPLSPAAPIDVPVGLVTTLPPTPPRRVRLIVHMNPADDGFGERVYVEMESRSPTQNFPRVLIAAEAEGCALVPCASPINLHYERDFELPLDQAGLIEFWGLENNAASDTEAALLTASIALDGAIHLEIASGPTEDNAFGNLSSNVQSLSVDRTFDQTVRFVDYAQNE